MNPIPIDSLTDPRVADYANIRDAELMQRADPLDPAAHRGLFIAEGELVLRRLAASRFETASVLTTHARLDGLRDVLETLPPATPMYIASQEVMNQVVGFNMHRGVLAIGRRPGEHDSRLANLLALSGPLLVLEDMFNHDNLGGVFRNAAALGGPGCAVLLSPRCADPLYRKSLRVSMGHVLSVPYARLEDWPGDLARIRAAGFSVLALSPRPEAAELSTAASSVGRSRVALMLGSEGPGLTDAAMAAADLLVRIPMSSPPGAEVDSLNVHVAAALALYELSRLRP